MASFIERVLILCKTYPSPSAKYAETSCVAGMTEDGKMIRLYPVPFRLVSDDQQFKKWQWITARFEKARDDHRPESHRVFVDTIVCDADPLPAGKLGWPHRAELLAKLTVYSDFSEIEKLRADGGPLMASPNSPTRGHPKFPQAARSDYDPSAWMAKRAAASLSL
jgi:hypothetical protein